MLNKWISINLVGRRISIRIFGIVIKYVPSYKTKRGDGGLQSFKNNSIINNVRHSIYEKEKSLLKNSKDKSIPISTILFLCKKFTIYEYCSRNYLIHLIPIDGLEKMNPKLTDAKWLNVGNIGYSKRKKKIVIINYI